MGQSLELTVEAENDLQNLDTNTRERILSKLEDIRTALSTYDLDPATVIEKRLSGPWHPVLQQRVGDHRIWFLDGTDTDNGDNSTVYVIRILAKDEQKDLTDTVIDPDTRP